MYNQSLYTAPLDYLISSYIREFDISKANINILLYKKLITQEQYNFYFHLDRMNRQIQLGLLQRDNKEIRDGLSSGFKETMEMFFKANDIQDHEVLAIKKDAIYLINKIPTVTKFSNIDFICKNVYTSFYKIKKIEFYYFSNNSTGEEYLHIKGISDTVLPLHERYFLEFLLVVFNSAQSDPIEETINIIQAFNSKYINLELDIGYYRNFNNESMYILRPVSSGFGFKAEHFPENKKRYVDISYNANIIRELYKVYSNIHFRTKNKR